MSAIVSDDEGAAGEVERDTFDDLGIQPPKYPGNYSARTTRRWSIDSKHSTTSSHGVDIDGVHSFVSPNHVFPAQLYSTESGRLFHAGNIVIALVGLPARGKTHLAVSLVRYLRWLGVKSHPFHVSDYRRATYTNFEDDVPQDYFSAEPKTKEGIYLRQKILHDCLGDILDFFEKENGQVAVYDALNALKKDRADVVKLFGKKGIKVLFIESIIDDDDLLLKNVNHASSSPDYVGWDPKLAKKDYLKRIHANQPIFQHMNADGEETDLSFIRFINFGERLVTHNSHNGYLINRIVFFLMNSRVKAGCVYFARCGKSDLDKYIEDDELNEEGLRYSEILAETVLKRIRDRKAEKQKAAKLISSTVNSANQTAESSTENLSASLRQPPTGDGSDENSFVVWTATRKRTSSSANPFRRRGIKVRERSQLNQLHPGAIADLTPEEIKVQFHEDYLQDIKDPYHHRYPRAESYHDLAVRMEPLLLEMERMNGDMLIIAHESTLAVLYGYLLACSCYEIPSLNFPRDELVEISYTPYENKAERIKIEGI